MSKSEQRQIKILFLASNPQQTAQLQLGQEFKEIDAALQRSQLRDRFELISKWAVDAVSLRQALLKEKPDIVHFSGHGEGEEGVVLEGRDGKPKPATAEALAGLCKEVSKRKKIGCVLLNACYAEVQGRAIVQYVDYVIGMRQEIRDDAAIAFASGFYDGLGYGLSIEDSFELGRNAIQFEVPSFSQTSRKLGPANSGVESQAIDSLKDELIPILLTRETLNNTELWVPPFYESRHENLTSEANILGQYRERVKVFVADGKLSPIKKIQLSIFARVLGVAQTDADKILEEEAKPDSPELVKYILLIILVTIFGMAILAFFVNKCKFLGLECPIAVSYRKETKEGESIDIKVLNNDGQKTVIDNTEPEHGRVTRSNDYSFTYQPNPNYSGKDSFEYTISDRYGNKSTATVVITVIPINDPPIVLPPRPVQPVEICEYERQDLETYLLGDLQCHELEPYQDSKWSNQEEFCQSGDDMSLINHLRSYKDGGRYDTALKCADQATYYAIVKILENPNTYNKLYPEDISKVSCRHWKIINFLWDYYTEGDFSLIKQKEIYKDVKQELNNKDFDYVKWANRLGWYKLETSWPNLNQIHDNLEIRESEPKGLFPLGAMFASWEEVLTLEKVKAHAEALLKYKLTKNDDLFNSNCSRLTENDR